MCKQLQGVVGKKIKTIFIPIFQLLDAFGLYSITKLVTGQSEEFHETKLSVIEDEFDWRKWAAVGLTGREPFVVTEMVSLGGPLPILL